MLLLVAFLLALLVLDPPWSFVVVAVALVVELGEAYFWWWLSRRRKPAVGVEAMIGASATVVRACRPLGQVRIQGELWRARADAGADEGDVVSVRAVDADGLTLVVEPA